MYINQKVLLIIPCYNEEKRLPVSEFLKFADLGHQIVFADDGSTDGTVAMLERVFSGRKNTKIYKAPFNQGKAEVIRWAIMELNKLGLPHDIEWVGFWDADLATPLDEVEYLLQFHKYFSPDSKAIISARVLRLGGKIVRSPLRHYLGRGFATLASILLNLKCYDSQCGAKLFHKSVLTTVFAQPFISKWIFDVEILLRLGQKNFIEVPLRKWQDIPGSKIKIGKEFIRVLRDLLKIRLQYGKPRE